MIFSHISKPPSPGARWQIYRLAVALLLATAAPSASASIFAVVPGNRLDLGDAREMEGRIREEIKRLGDDPFALHELGTVLYRQHRVDQARELWDQAAANESELAVAEVEVVFELLEAGDLPGAQAALAAAREKRPVDPHVYLAAGQVAMASRDFDTARGAYDRARQLRPNSAAVLLSRGRFLQYSGDNAQARSEFEAAAKITADQPAAWLLLAADDFQQDRIDACLKNLQQAEACRPGQPLAEARLAEYYMQLGDYPSAYRWFGRALTRQPEDKLLKTRVGQMLSVLNRPDEAREALSAVVAKEECVSALVSLAQLEEAAGELDSAAALMERVLKQDGNNIVASNNLAMLLVQLDKSPERALELAEQARRLGGDRPQVQSTYACALVHAGKFAAAAELLRPAVRREPNDPWLRYCYGVALAKTNQLEAAKEQFQACLLLKDNFPRKEQIKALVPLE
jgi:tetratricopeptide (TPR) repeat protein